LAVSLSYITPGGGLHTDRVVRRSQYDSASFQSVQVAATYMPPSTVGGQPQLLYGNQAPPKNPLQARLESPDGCVPHLRPSPA
jgi:hypothetical protein